MGRRSSKDVMLTPKEMVERLRVKFQALNAMPHVNMVQFTAQRFEEDAVKFVNDCIYAEEVPLAVRIECAERIVTWARGKPRDWAHNGETINPEAPGTIGATVGEEIAAAKEAAVVYGELDRLVRAAVPYKDWPAELRSRAEAQVFADESEEEPEAEALPALPAA